MKMNVLGLLSNLVTRRIEFLGDGDDYATSPQGEVCDVFDGANVVTSKRTDSRDGIERHAVLLDLDVPAVIIPSSTEGHGHLYIDVDCSWGNYRNLLDALARCGVIESGYAQASKRKGASYLRLPWVKKQKQGVDPWADFVKPAPKF